MKFSENLNRCVFVMDLNLRRAHLSDGTFSHVAVQMQFEELKIEHIRAAKCENVPSDICMHTPVSVSSLSPLLCFYIVLGYTCFTAMFHR